MSAKYNFSPTEKVNYVQKGKSKGRQVQTMQQVAISFLILGILVLIVLPSYHNNRKRQDLKNEIDAIKKDISRYENSNGDLEELLSYLSSKQAIEEKARLNFGLQKRGEQVVVIQKKGDIGGQPEINNQTKEELSNSKKWLNYFFN